MIPLGHATQADRPWSRYLAFIPDLLRSRASAPEQYGAALHAVAARPDDAVAIDVQLPFCPMLCTYCASNVTVTHDGSQIDRYVDALVAEIALVAEHVGPAREVVQVHFGGGTPNYLAIDQLARIVGALRRHFALLPETESTIDCDPRRVCPSQLDGLRALGFNHVRFGMADLEPAVQRAAGRLQSAAMLRDVCTLALQSGFETVCVDMLYGLPGQHERSMRKTLEQVIDIGPDRVCCHPYLHRPVERRHQCALDIEQLPDREQAAALFRCAADMLVEAGYSWIGLDHFVLDTDELALAQATGELHCNALGYTARPQAHVLGFGAGAAGEVNGTCIRNEPSRPAWQAQVEAGVLPVSQARRLDADELRCCEATERLLCDLALQGALADALPGSARKNLTPLAEAGLVSISRQGIEVTPQGRFALDRLCAALAHAGPDRVPGVRV